jgi:hypothetical protein
MASAVYVLTLTWVVRGRSRCRAIVVGHTCRCCWVSIHWVAGAARSRRSPICQAVSSGVRACLVWGTAQGTRACPPDEAGSGRAWARRAGEATVRPGTR